MPTLIDYTLAAASVANPDASHPAVFSAATVVDGPGATALGTYAHALDLHASAAVAATCDLSGLSPDRTRFTVEAVVRLDAAPTAAQPILTSTLLPFSLTAVPASGGAVVQAQLQLATPAFDGVQGTTVLQPGAWHTLTLAYDLDTLAVFVDHVIEGVHAYPSGQVAPAGAAVLEIAGGPLTIAAVRWQDDIDPSLETQLDDLRDGAQWAITRRREQLGATLGTPDGALAYDSGIGAWVQHFTAGLLMWAESTGVACEMHGAIWGLYVSLQDPSPLGILISDELDAGAPGSRRSTFTAGTIYWSQATGPVPVIGHLYTDYERLHGPRGFLGLPVDFSQAVAGGLEQVFQGGRMYYRQGDGAAHEVHGAILDRYLATGGVGTWGFPITDETDVLVLRDENDIHSGSVSIGRMSTFDGATFYWSGATGAHELHGDLRAWYLANGPAARSLGLPTTDEMDVPGGGGRMNLFPGGALVWPGSYAGITFVHPFQLHIGRIDTVEDEGFGKGQNDVYGRVTVTQGGATLYDQRQPGSGDSDDHNVVDWNLTLPMRIQPTLDAVHVKIDLNDSDWPDGDDHLGTWTLDLTPANLWGLGLSQGVIHSGHFSNVNDILLTVMPDVDVAALSPAQKWWGVRNRGTDTIPYPLYATAFEDVDSDPEWYDPGDWLARGYYAAVAEHLARGGNCFGMCVAAIDALKRSGPFSLPLDRFSDGAGSWGIVEQQFNVRHQYQVGAGPIWWFVNEFLNGRTHSPKAVFQATRDAYARGDNPVLCISQNSDFSGAPHCIMPVGWDTSATPWKLMVQDPNFPASAPRVLEVDPNADTYHYAGGSEYRGTASSGGRMHWMPYHLLCHAQDTPIGELLALLVAGTILVLGAGAESSGITDADGNDLDASGSRAAGVLGSGGTLGGYFMPVRGSSDPGSDRLRHLTVKDAAVLKDAAVVKDAAIVHEAKSPGGAVKDAVQDAVRLPVDVIRDPGRIIVQPLPIATSDPVAGGLLMRPGTVVRDVVLTKRPKRVFLPPRIGGIITKPLLEGPKATPGVVSAIAKDAAVSRLTAARSVHNVLADDKLVAHLDPAVIVALGSLLTPSDTDFVHHVTGSGDAFDYAVKRGLTEIRVSSPLAAGEKTSLAVEGLGTAKAVVGLTAATAKTASVSIEHRPGIAGDRIAIRLDQVPVGPDADLKVNVKPGIAGVEVFSAGAKMQVPVVIDGVLGGVKFGGAFTVPMDGGLRLAPSSLLATGALRAATIPALFAPATAVIQVSPA